MSGIFISYRRDDAQGEARLLFDQLRRHFGVDLVFLDVTNITSGADFRTDIENAVGTCDVLITLIGKHWLGATDRLEKNRLENTNDFVRLEAKAALSRGIRVIPVLVQGATMPLVEQLPEDLEALAGKNAFELRHTRWDEDFAILRKQLERFVIRKKFPWLSRKYTLIGILTMGASLLAYVVPRLEVECSSNFFPDSGYAVWHKGSTSAEQNGEVTFLHPHECADGTCFEGTIGFPGYNNEIFGYWKDSRIKFTRYVSGNYQQVWEGICRLGSTDGKWNLPDKSDYGPFTIKY